MLKMLTAFTTEVDEGQYALEEILQGLDLENNQLTHAAGILTCHPDYFETGVAQYIAEKLPFDVIGSTTIANATAGTADELLLCLSVLTSDDIKFTSGWTTTLEGESDAPLKAAFAEANCREGGAMPSMVITFAPLLRTVAAENVLINMSDIIHGAPLFGMVSCDNTSDYSRCYTLHNGQAAQTSLAMLLLWGEVDPTFFMVSISEDKIQKFRAIITKSSGALLEKVNDLPLLEYLQTIGVSTGDERAGAGVIPFMVDYQDGSQPVARAMYTITPEGTAICGGYMPVNATLAIGSIDTEDVMTTSRRLMLEALGTGKKSGVLLFPCSSRYVVMGTTAYSEVHLAKELFDGIVPYQFAYAGGEICPIADSDGNLLNRFHNFSLIACIF